MERNLRSTGGRLPACPPPLHLSLGSHSSHLHGPLLPACLRPVLGRASASAVRSVPPAPLPSLPHLPSLLGLPPSPLAPFPQLTTRAGSPTPCVNLALNLPPPQLHSHPVSVPALSRRSFLLPHFAAPPDLLDGLLLLARGWKRSH